jgi:DNA-binding PucR family transcriptional regulator
MLTQLPDRELHPGLEGLLADAQYLPLLETLETYLDLAGSAVATSKALRLHRTSLYYRLQRVEELARTDLKDGGERLALHLSLKLARLSGRYLPREPPGPS